MDYSNEDIKEALIGGAVVLGSLAIRKIMEKSWVAVTKKDPPKNPEDREVEWKEAVVWTLCVGTMVGLTRLIVRRNAAVGIEKWLKI